MIHYNDNLILKIGKYEYHYSSHCFWRILSKKIHSCKNKWKEEIIQVGTWFCVNEVSSCSSYFRATAAIGLYHPPKE